MNNYITNCPNCGAPLTRYGKCEYCGTIIDRPLQIISVQPGMKKIICEAQVPLWMGEKDAEVAAEYVKHDIQAKMADALTDSIRFLSNRRFDPLRLEEIITVRGELFVMSPEEYFRY